MTDASYTQVTGKLDLIYRQAAIDLLETGTELLKRVLDDTDIVGNDRDKFAWGLVLIESSIADMKELPSAEPELKKGQWIVKEQFVNSPEFYSWQCSVCGCVLEDPTLDKPYPFCPNCGADMRGEQDETD